MPKFEVNLSDELYARLTRGARRDRVHRTDWAREALAAKAAYGEALELHADPATVDRLAEHETRITALEQQRLTDA